MQTLVGPDNNRQVLVTTVQAYLTLLQDPHHNMRVISLNQWPKAFHPINSLQCTRIGWLFTVLTRNRLPRLE